MVQLAQAGGTHSPHSLGTASPYGILTSITGHGLAESCCSPHPFYNLKLDKPLLHKPDEWLFAKTEMSVSSSDIVTW